MPRPTFRLLVLALGIVVTLSFTYQRMEMASAMPQLHSDPLSTSVDHLAHLSPNTQTGQAIMGHIKNETVKAELGRAAWKLFHTTMAQFPETPSPDESAALKSYVYLFARLYPCRECAANFLQILQDYPPQTSSRNSAAAWACYVHNEVNKSKGKEIFDCKNIGDFYDCGCGEDDSATDLAAEEDGGSASPNHQSSQSKTERNSDHVGDIQPDQITRESWTNGG